MSPKAAGLVTMYEVMMAQKFKGIDSAFKTPQAALRYRVWRRCYNGGEGPFPTLKTVKMFRFHFAAACNILI